MWPNQWGNRKNIIWVQGNKRIDRKNNNVYHGGNFHGDYIGLEMDKLKIAMTKMSMLIERQLNYILNDKLKSSGIEVTLDVDEEFVKSFGVESGDVEDFKGDIRLNKVQNITVKNSTFNNIRIDDCNPTLINNN